MRLSSAGACLAWASLAVNNLNSFQGEILVPYHARTTAPTRLTALAIIAVIIGLFLTALGPVMQASAAPVTAGYKDHSYGAGVGSPTEDKPQSKVWFTDGSWWAGMFVDGSDDYRIHKYNASTHVWTATSTVVDDRNSSHGDYLWDGATNSLYVASVNGDTDPDPILVFKLNYNPSTDTYTHDPLFGSAGVTVGTGPAETVTIAKDSTSQLWVTYQNHVDPLDVNSDRKVMVNRSTTNEQTWGSAFQVGANTGPDDISAIIAFGGNAVGIMWSEHRAADTTSAFHFSTHLDSNTTDTGFSAPTNIAGGPTFAEDHINLKLTATGSGQVLAALKTSGTPNRIQLFSRNPGTGAWTAHPVVGSSQDVTRPQVVVDETNARAYVLFTAPENDSAGNQAIYYKSAPLSTLSFNSAGLGTAFIMDGVNDISDVSTSKLGVTAASDLMAIASSDTNTSYYHGFLAISGPPPPPPPPGGGDHPFTDIDNHPFENDIIWLYNEKITSGCTETRFCPDSNVLRDQMASFLDRALHLPATSTDFFNDDEGNIHEAAINRLAASGITGGCATRKYCPRDPVKRDQMASFLVRAFHLPFSSLDRFTDDEGNQHENQINTLAASGITGGCGPGRYCPSSLVTRGQMAAFLHRALD
jgi:S-layer family protein